MSIRIVAKHSEARYWDLRTATAGPKKGIAVSWARALGIMAIGALTRSISGITNEKPVFGRAKEGHGLTHAKKLGRWAVN